MKYANLISILIETIINSNSLSNEQQLWSADLAVESIKDTFPSEAEQMKKILREVEDKMNTLRIGTKQFIGRMALAMMASMLPGENMIRELIVSATFVCENQ